VILLKSLQGSVDFQEIYEKSLPYLKELFGLDLDARTPESTSPSTKEESDLRNRGLPLNIGERGLKVGSQSLIPERVDLHGKKNSTGHRAQKGGRSNVR